MGRIETMDNVMVVVGLEFLLMVEDGGIYSVKGQVGYCEETKPGTFILISNALYPH
jgi:hypothetical protein